MSAAQLAADSCVVTKEWPLGGAIQSRGRSAQDTSRASSGSARSSSDVPGRMRSSSSARVASSHSSRRTTPFPSHSRKPSGSGFDSLSGYGTLSTYETPSAPSAGATQAAYPPSNGRPTSSAQRSLACATSAGSESAQSCPSAFHEIAPSRRLRGITTSEGYERFLLHAECYLAGRTDGRRMADAQRAVRSALRGDRDLQAEPRCLAEPALRLRHGPQPARQRNLAERAHRAERHTAR